MGVEMPSLYDDLGVTRSATDTEVCSLHEHNEPVQHLLTRQALIGV